MRIKVYHKDDTKQIKKKKKRKGGEYHLLRGSEQGTSIEGLCSNNDELEQVRNQNLDRDRKRMKDEIF